MSTLVLLMLLVLECDRLYCSGVSTTGEGGVCPVTGPEVTGESSHEPLRHEQKPLDALF